MHTNPSSAAIAALTTDTTQTDGLIRAIDALHDPDRLRELHLAIPRHDGGVPGRIGHESGTVDEEGAPEEMTRGEESERWLLSG